MPRNKQVYGRRPKTTAVFAASTAFNWSSPVKRTPERDVNGGVTEVSNGLRKLDLYEEDRNARGIHTATGSVLCARDTNAILKSPQRDGTEKRKKGKGTGEISVVVKSRSKILESPESGCKSWDSKQGQRDGTKLSERITKPKRSRQADPQDNPVKPGETQETTSESSKTSQSPPATLSTRPTRTRRAKQPKLPPAPIPISNDPLTTYTKPLLDLCSDPVGRTCPTPFSEWADTLTPYFSITKIAEATYGEVYRLSLLSPRATLTASDESVLKIIALKPPPPPGSRRQRAARTADAEADTDGMSAVPAVASEVRLLRRMTRVPGRRSIRRGRGERRARFRTPARRRVTARSSCGR